MVVYSVSYLGSVLDHKVYQFEKASNLNYYDLTPAAYIAFTKTSYGRVIDVTYSEVPGCNMVVFLLQACESTGEPKGAYINDRYQILLRDNDIHQFVELAQEGYLKDHKVIQFKERTEAGARRWNIHLYKYKET